MSQFTPTIQKELRPIIKRLCKQGWSIEPTGGTHVRVLTPEGKTATILACSSRNWNNIKRAKLALRKAGADI